MPFPSTDLGARVEAAVRREGLKLSDSGKTQAAFVLRLTSKPSASIRRASRFASTAGS